MFAWRLACAFGLSSTPALAAGNAARGYEIFKGTCDAATKIGPNLFRVVGRKAGTLPHFRYSAAMHGSGVIWTPDVLRRYVNAPQKTIPNVRMAFPGLNDPQKADDVVAYLETLK